MACEPMRLHAESAGCFTTAEFPHIYRRVGERHRIANRCYQLVRLRVNEANASQIGFGDSYFAERGRSEP